jgi:hypothetical protein
MEGQSSKKLKRTLADRLAGQEQVEKKFEKANLGKKAKLEKKKQRRLSKGSASDGAQSSEELNEMQTESGGLLEKAGYARIDSKLHTTNNNNTSLGSEATIPQQEQPVPVNTQDLVALINAAQIERLRGVIKICLKYVRDV